MTKLAEAVRTIAPHCNPLYLGALAVFEPKFIASGLTDDRPLRQSQFLGQFLGETGGGEVLQENMTYSTVDRLMEIFGIGRHSAAITLDEAQRIIAMPHDKRGPAIGERVYGAGNTHMMNMLGNRPGDGYVFRGIGPLQSTGRGAAVRWGANLGVDFASNVALMLDPRVVWSPTLFEWDAGKLNSFADKNDIRTIRRVINGGYNGLADCEAWHEKAWAVLKSADHPAATWQAADPDTTTTRLQTALNLLGYTPKLAIDGRYGDATKAAVKWFQHLNGLLEDGVAGRATVAVINLRCAARRAA